MWDTNMLRIQANIVGRAAKKIDAVTITQEIQRRRIALMAELNALETIEKDMRKLYRATRKAKRGITK
jgi:hypothetical protein